MDEKYRIKDKIIYNMENKPKLINREGYNVKLTHSKDNVYDLIFELTKDLDDDNSSDYYYFNDFLITEDLETAIEYVRNDGSLIDTLLILWINLSLNKQ